MASFETFAKIKLRAESLPSATLNDFYEAFSAKAQWLVTGTARCVALFDVDIAEEAVAWLKEHGVEQEPKAPERDTGRCQDPECELRLWLDSPSPRGPSPIVPIKNGKHVHERGKNCSVCGGKLTEMPGGSLWCSMHGPRGPSGIAT